MAWLRFPNEIAAPQCFILFLVGKWCDRCVILVYLVLIQK